MTLTEFLLSKKFPMACSLPLDGAYHRFDRNGPLTGYFRGRELTFQDQKVSAIVCGDFKGGEFYQYTTPLTSPTLETQSKLQSVFATMREEEAADRAAMQERVALECQAFFSDCIPQGDSPYLTRKGFKRGLYGARLDPDYPTTLIIPARDVHGKLWTYQRILAEKMSSGLDKVMCRGGRAQGSFFVFGTLKNQEKIYVCEGFATGLSIHHALSLPVACAFSAGNLSHVSRALRAVYPSATLVLCADNDAFTFREDKVTPWNPGLEKAQAACSAVSGLLALPHFRNLDSKPTDFNDLHILEGLEVVKQQLLNPQVQAVGAGGGAPSEGALPDPLTSEPPPEKPKKKRFSEKLLADWMMAAYPGTLVRQDKSIFHYDGRKWNELDSHGIDQLKNQINSMCGDALTSKDVNSAFNSFFRYIPTVPQGVNLFQPRRDLANFQNGALHLEFRHKTPAELQMEPGAGTHWFSLRFTPHRPEDFCTTVIPLDYRPESELKDNEELLTMYRSVWPDADQGGKIALYEELLGACLVPTFPTVAFFVGAPKTGKSSLIMLLGKLVGLENASHVDPTLWGKNFGMESMVNKLVNFDTDISTTRRLPDDLTKKVIDGVFNIERKYKANIQARLPALHAFGANEMPRTGEGGSNVYGRRAVIIRTDTVQPGQGGGGSFSDWVWGRGPDGVLKAALRGLTRLLSRGGIYSTPDSSHQEMAEWGRDNDQVALFLEAVEHGEVRVGGSGNPGEQRSLIVSKYASISISGLYELFCGFITCHEGHGKGWGRVIDRTQFSKRLYRDLRFVPQRNNRERRVMGLGSGAE